MEASKQEAPVASRLIPLFWASRCKSGSEPCCWYSNKERRCLCVIPALPAHLSTMLRRTPLQMYAKHTDTAPSHTSPQFPSFSHTPRGSPPWPPPPHLSAHTTNTVSHLKFFPFQRWSKTNYTDWSTKPFTMITAEGSVLRFNRTSGEKTTKQTWHGERGMRGLMWGEAVCLCVCVCYEKSFSRWFMPLSRLGYESGMMLQRAALHLMLAHLKRADLCSLSGLTSPPPLLLLLLRPLRSEKLVVIIDHRYCSNLLWKMN